MANKRINESATSKSRMQESSKGRVTGSATSKPREVKPISPKK